MNPLTQTKNLQKLIENEIKIGAVGTTKSWHNQYRDSAWIFFGGMPYELTEGDIICVFSQYGEVVNINLIRDRKTGKSKGFGFVCYENQKSTDLAVDNFNGTKILGRIIKVDHAGNYKPPKEYEDADDITKFLRESGCQGDLHQFEEQKGTRLIKEIKTEKNDDEKIKNYERQYKKSRSRSKERDKRKKRDKDRDQNKESNKKRSRSKNRDRSRSKKRDRSRSKKRERNQSRDRTRKDQSNKYKY